MLSEVPCAACFLSNMTGSAVSHPEINSHSQYLTVRAVRFRLVGSFQCAHHNTPALIHPVIMPESNTAQKCPARIKYGAVDAAAGGFPCRRG